ncbi:MAG TPA: HEAT repeat domain-containing protein [Candidatus Sulfotelmatobacter sp.]|nr:HEAT repeat domain-containing protein [Candidatus Sulfotelmatobacter sp.]
MPSRGICVPLIFALISSISLVPASTLCSAETGKDVAWNLIMSGLHSNSSEERVVAVRVLGLLINNNKAGELAEHALGDDKPEVRSAAATALGQMHSTASISKLRQTLSDKEISVALAAARALHTMNDRSGYDFYYEILTGERKGSEGFIAKQTAVLHEPKKLAELGFEQGIGYIPYAGMGWDALRVILKNDASPVRAAAATMIADDPDPNSAKALVKATQDKNWIVRVAALEAISKRGDPTLGVTIETSMYDPKSEVRFAAAATVVHLTDLAEVSKPVKQAQTNAEGSPSARRNE